MRQIMPFNGPDTFEVQPPLGWGKPVLGWSKPVEAPSPNPSWANDENKKKLFGIELTKHETAFQAACAMFEDTTQALWASHYWITDPIVLASKDLYNEAINLKLLDKDGLAIKLLKFADEKGPNGYPTVDAKDRLAALRLFAEIQGFIGKVEATPSNTYNDNRVMKILLVKPNNQNNKIVDTEVVQEQPEFKSVGNIKLVSAR